MVEIPVASRILVGKLEGKGPPGTCRRKLEGNSEMNLKETETEYMDRIQLVQNRIQWWALVNTVTNTCTP
jgi:hypothetical protein